MKLRLFGSHKPVCPDRLSGETSAVARSLARQGWMGRQIVADIGGAGDATCVPETGFDASRRIAMRMGAPGWLT